MTDSASVDKNENILLGLVDKLHDFVKDECLNLSIILRWKGIDGCPESSRWDLLMDQVSGQHEIHGTSLSIKHEEPIHSSENDYTYRNNTVGKDPIDLCTGGSSIGQRCLRDRELLGSLEVSIKSINSRENYVVIAIICALNMYLPSPRVWCSMGLLFCCVVLGTPTI